MISLVSIVWNNATQKVPWNRTTVFHISTSRLLQPFSWISRLLSKENLLTWVLNVPQMASLCFIGDCVNLCLTNASKSMRPALNFTPMSALHQCAPMCNNVNTALYNLYVPVCVCVLVCLFVCECVRVCVLSSLELLALVQPGCSTHLGFFQS